MIRIPYISKLRARIRELEAHRDAIAAELTARRRRQRKLCGECKRHIWSEPEIEVVEADPWLRDLSRVIGFEQEQDFADVRKHCEDCGSNTDVHPIWCGSEPINEWDKQHREQYRQRERSK